MFSRMPIKYFEENKGNYQNLFDSLINTLPKASGVKLLSHLVKLKLETAWFSL